MYILHCIFINKLKQDSQDCVSFLSQDYFGYSESFMFPYKFLFSVQFSRSVMSDSLQSHEPQHAGPPSPTPGVHPNHVH